MSDSDWSAPRTDVLAHVREVLDGDGRGVLATVVAVEGSAYRRPGAKMVIPEDEGGIGHITAGCLEDEVERIASEVLESGEPRVETYDLTPEAEDDVWGLGVGCNGIIDVLIEPIDGSYRPVLDAAAADEDVCVLTVLDGERSGARAYYDPAADAFDLADGFPADVAEGLREAAGDLAASGKADSLEVDDTTAFVEGIAAPDDLVVVGTGPDVAPIAELGAKAGFRVTVVGFRGANATPDRFPAADDVRSTSPARIREAVDLDESTSVVVATHNFVDDRLALDELLGSAVPYVGLLGPRDRFEEMQEAFADEGRTFSEAELERVYTPVGLDLGVGTPYGIALSIVSEVLAVSNGREPGHLKDREGPIHDRLELSAGDD